MAPVIKRPASAAARASVPVAKKPHVAKEGDARNQKSASLASVIQEAELPESMRGIFGNATVLKECFAVPKEERHKFQEDTAQMLAEVLEALESKLRTKVSELEAKVSNAEVDKAAREAAVTAATEALEVKKAAEETAQGDDTAGVDGVFAARDALKAAESAQKTGDADLDEASGKKEKLERIKVGLYENLKSSETMEAGQRSVAINDLLSVGSAFGFDNTLMQSFKTVLEKTPEARGSFDAMCLKQVDDEFDKHIASLAATIANGESAKSERAAAVGAAEEALKAAEQTRDATKEKKTSAVMERREATSALTQATKALKAWGPEQKHTKDALDQAMAAVESFRSGPLATYKELEAWTKTAPTEPVVGAPDAAAAQDGAATMACEDVVTEQVAVSGQ